MRTKGLVSYERCNYTIDNETKQLIEVLQVRLCDNSKSNIIRRAIRLLEKMSRSGADVRIDGKEVIVI